MAKSKFHYKGPVFKVGTYIGDWEGDTWAPSEAKALANLCFRYKTTHNLVPSAKISLDADSLSETTAIEDDQTIGQYHQMTLDELFALK